MALTKLTAIITSIVYALLAQAADANFCDPPSPAFFPPNISHPAHTKLLSHTTAKLSSHLNRLISSYEYNTTSFSVEVTSQTETLLSLHHTARERSTLYHGGAKVINDTTCYRIASITKSFTVLALFQLQEVGKLNLDDSILTYLPDLNGTGHLPWKDITIHSLASQNAGLPRDFAQDDYVNHPEVPDKLGLPRLDPHSKQYRDLPSCDEMVNYTRSCDEDDFLDWIKRIQPTFAPNQRSSYSNINFDLLGLVIGNVTGMSYERYVTEHILEPLGLTSGTGFEAPPDAQAAIAKGIEYYWSFYIGVQNPTGGLYANTKDMSIWLRYALSTFNAHAHGALNWFQPTSWSDGLSTFYGMPWEIFRAKTSDIIDSKSDRALTFITKGGGLPGYTSWIVMIPEYSIGITVLVAGNSKAMSEIAHIVIREMVALAEEIVLKELHSQYVGQYVDHVNNDTTMVIKVSETNGLYVDSWTSNGTDVKKGLKDFFSQDGSDIVLHLSPTLLYANQKGQQGERWRILLRKASTGRPEKPSVWDKFCVADVELFMYGGVAMNELVFWKGEDGATDEIEPVAYRTSLKRSAAVGTYSPYESGDQAYVGS
ncbi:hypothetical protein LTR64_006891 [Lithohypha guttulata]|uniref:uncharacterized protein n=1 Tax=Lithohypha guttulata TaxID=1690604 RepID=UPI002DDEB629|nr:hypothetical protein LTR51_004551 [Lithohypha guttulata]